jgi:hypothetical protein
VLLPTKLKFTTDKNPEGALMCLFIGLFSAEALDQLVAAPIVFVHSAKRSEKTIGKPAIARDGMEQTR